MYIKNNLQGKKMCNITKMNQAHVKRSRFVVKYFETATFLRWPLVLMLKWKLYSILVVGEKIKYVLF